MHDSAHFGGRLAGLYSCEDCGYQIPDAFAGKKRDLTLIDDADSRVGSGYKAADLRHESDQGHLLSVR